MQADALEGGFRDAAVEAAQAFRAAMNVMARPGRIETLSGAVPPMPASPAAGVLLLTLCDPETPVHLAGAYDSKALRDWITFHTGALLVDAQRAEFALGDWPALQPLSAYCPGTPDYPDRSATLIVERPTLNAGGAALRGPGIRGLAHLDLPDPEAFRTNAQRFPMGLDFFFTSGSRVAALPRTTQVESG